jgi:hypothetical protein
MDQPTAEAALRALQPLVGEWTVEARTPPGAAWSGATGHATFAWHPSGAHLVETSTIDDPDAPDSISVMGCDAANGTFTQLYADERGVCRTYDMSIGDGEWKLSRHGPPFAQRFTATFSDDGNTITGRWEIAEDGDDFALDFDLILRRVTGRDEP